MSSILGCTSATFGSCSWATTAVKTEKITHFSITSKMHRMPSEMHNPSASKVKNEIKMRREKNATTTKTCIQKLRTTWTEGERETLHQNRTRNRRYNIDWIEKRTWSERHGCVHSPIWWKEWVSECARRREVQNISLPCIDLEFLTIRLSDFSSARWRARTHAAVPKMHKQKSFGYLVVNWTYFERRHCVKKLVVVVSK